ncbi:MAG: hypothetical protein KY469_01455 [Actinobacteria bacterium]|nr:hypothetical protein [Actinomycetota bacterium]
MESLLERVGDVFGGGSLTPILIVAGVIALFIAYKAVKLVMRLIALGIGAAFLLGTAPWSGAPPVEGAEAACAEAAVAEALSSWQLTITKRTTVSELSGDAACEGDRSGLASGTATVKLRTFFDIPFQTWRVDSSGASATSLG